MKRNHIQIPIIVSALTIVAVMDWLLDENGTNSSAFRRTSDSRESGAEDDSGEPERNRFGGLRSRPSRSRRR